MKKIAIIGCGGAGKSTLSRQISQVLGLPLYHLDQLHWKPGWEATPKDEWDVVVKDLAVKETWIIDGNYGRTLDIRLKEADTIIYMNMPLYLCLYRVIKRRVMYHGKTRPDIGQGCPERLDLDFIKWVIRYHKKQKPRMLQKLSDMKTEKKVIILSRPREVKEYLNKIKVEAH